ncbi:MAG: acyltransferase domain-containing protein [Acidobacteriia bacterium]|nr:acyltransferase domain-containing protein [Terriglobia bacterium]
MADFLERISKLPPKKLALLVRDLQQRLDSIEKDKREPIAIVGIGCRFPGGANSPEEFWRLLQDGVDAISEVPPERWDLDSIYDPEPGKPGKTCSRYGGFLKEVDQFDPLFFGISPREAASMDPQQRLLLEVVWETLENAGQSPEKLSETQTGVFVGISGTDYMRVMLACDPKELDMYLATGGALSTASGRISYLLGLHGPSISVDTACSSSLVAFHLACQSIRSGESKIALACGVNLVLNPAVAIALSRSHMLAPDGRCKAFDASGDGFVRSEGCGAVVLKNLSDAVANRDRILALVRGTAANQDGRSSGLTAPNGPSQEAVVRAALAAANTTPSEIDYIETHGTGTSLGDPIEAGALGNVFGRDRDRLPPLTIGSVKTNLGHLESAAGIVGLIKTVLALEREEIPPSLHFKSPNPHIPWDQLPIVVAVKPTPWVRGTRPRLAGVSSFGFSGTNVHVILAEAPIQGVAGSEQDRPAHVYTVSAKSETALVENVRRHAQALGGEHMSLANACYTANAGRAHFPHRVACMSRSLDELRVQLEAFAAGELAPGSVSGNVRGSSPTEVVFLFPGQGAQYPGMTRKLYQSESTFRQAMDRCAEALKGRIEKPLLEVLFESGPEDSSLHDPVYAQPANFAVEYAAAEMWRSWGVAPSAVVGHSLGEFGAACVAGMCSPEDAIRLVATRGRLMQGLPPTGAMAAVHAREELVAAAIAELGGRGAIAAVNHPEQTVVSGLRASVEAVAELMQAQGIEVEWLRAYHGYHSPEMQPMADELVRAARGAKFDAPAISFVSTMTGKPLLSGKTLEPEYWGQQVVAPVHFVAAVKSLRELRYSVFLDMGPAPVLGGMGRYCYPDGVWLATLRPGREDWEQALDTLAALHVAGVAIDWEAFDRPYPRQRIALPTSVFERQRYWAAEPDLEQPALLKTAHVGTAVHPLLGVRVDHAMPTFETRLGPAGVPAVGAHRIGEMAVLPGPVYFEMALAAAAEVLGPGPHMVEDLVIKEALVLDDADRTVQTVVTQEGQGTGVFQVCSRTNNGDSKLWRKHASARLRPTLTDELSHQGLDQAKTRCPEPVCLDALREQLRALGVEIPAIDSVDRAWQGTSEVLAHLCLPADQAEQRSRYCFDPAAADAALLSFAALLSTTPAESTEGSYFLAGVDRVVVQERPGEKLWSYAKLRPVNEKPVRLYMGDLFIYSEAGAMIAAFHGLRFQWANKASLAVAQSQAGPEKDWFYRLEWEPTNARGNSDIKDSDRSIRSSVDVAIERLPSQAEAHVREYRLEEYEAMRPDLDRACAGYIVNAFQQLGWDLVPGDRKQADDLASRLGVAAKHRRLFGRLLKVLDGEGILKADEDTCEVTHHPGSLAPDVLMAGLRERHNRLRPQIDLVEKCGRRLGAVLRAELDPLQLLFEGGSHAETEALYKDSPSAKAFNTLVGDAAAAFVAAGFPKAKLRVLEIGAGTGGTSAFVLPVLPADRTEYFFTDISVAFLERAREKFAEFPFVQYEILDIERNPQVQAFSQGSFDLVIATNVLHATSDIRKALANVRSLLAPGGMLLLLEVTRIERWVDLTFGLTDGWWKFSDHDLRPEGPALSASCWKQVLGEAGFQPAIVADSERIASGSPPLALIVAEAVDKKSPQALDVGTQAAGPRWIVFAGTDNTGTAVVDALQRRRNLCAIVSPGDRYTRTDVHFTVDPQRPQDFERAIREASDGSPNEIVFLWGLEAGRVSDNSDAAEKVTAMCASAARLVQGAVAANAGSRLWLVTQGAQAAGKTSHSLACEQAALWGLGRAIALEEPDIWGGLLDLDPRERLEDQAAWIIGNVTCADGEDQVAVRDGLRLAARLARLPSLPSGTLSVGPEGSYLITGGLGALGLKIARWLVEHKARHLVLIGRRGLPERTSWADVDPTTEAGRCIAAVNALEAMGATANVMAADVSDRSGMENLFARFGRAWPALHGVVHAAVKVPDERRICDLDERALREMLSAKVAGTRNLMDLAGNQPLEFVALFSSMAALLGLKGGGHYAAASQYLDAIAHDRRLSGLPVTSIDWGGWNEMRSPTGEIRRVVRVGPTTGSIHPMPSSKALEAMEAALISGLPQVAVAAIDWETFRSLHESRRPRALTSRLGSQGKRTAPPVGKEGTRDLRSRLSAAAQTERRGILQTFVRAAIARVLGIRNPDSIDPDKGLFEMGLDSLMSIDLKTRLEIGAGHPLPSTLIFNYPSISALTEYLAEDLLGRADQASSESRAEPIPETGPEGVGETIQPREASRMPDGLDGLSDDQVDDLLKEMLGQPGTTL